MFDLPSMLGEYLLPLLILLPLAVVLVLFASRGSHREDAPPPALPPRWIPPSPPPRPVVPPVAAPVAAPASLSDSPPAASADALASPPAARTAEPVPTFAPSSPFLDPFDPDPETRPFAPFGEAAYAPTQPAELTPLSSKTPLPLPPAAGAGAPLLVVDDSAVVRAKLSKLLAAAGYSVTVARHGAEALEQIHQHWFAVMITDLEMPEMDGFELINHVSNDLRTENLPIVAITGHEALQAKVQDAKGLFGIFKKPWNDRELLARVAVLAQLRPRS